MGRVERSTPPSASPLHQEIHQNPAAGPAADEDLYEPPADYQPPPPHAAPPKHDKPPENFPPAHDFVKPPSSATAFPPPQDPTAQPFPPTQPPQYPHFHQQQQMNPPHQGIAMGIAPSPLIPQNNLLQINQPWSSHLFDCMANPQNAIVTLFFPCVTFGQIAEILDNGGTTCASSGMVYSCVLFCLAMPCLMSCGYRSKLRARFGLAESPAPDCLIHCFCEWCALCQEYRELEKRGIDPSIGHAGNVARRQQQLQQLGMMPPMQQRMI